MGEPLICSVEWKKPDLKESISTIPFISNSKRGGIAEEERRQNAGYLGVGVYGSVGWEEGGDFGKVLGIFYILI